MPLDEVMNALGGAGQVLVAAVFGVMLLMIVLWILVPFTVLGLRGRLSEVRDDQRKVLAALADQQRLLNDMLGALIDEQQVTNDLLSRVVPPDEAEELPKQTASNSPPPPPPPSVGSPERSATLDGRATDRGPRPQRPLYANR